MYVKLIDGKIEEAPQNYNGIINYNLDVERMIADGYKFFVPVTPPSEEEIRMYHYEYIENIDNIQETIVYDETQEEADLRKLNQAKENKIVENDTVRDEALLQGVTYKNVLFDSDTDQKVNLLATVGGMNGEETIMWYGMDNQGLECTKEDLKNIGGLITQLHSFCWTRNAQIKQDINEAETIEEVDEVEIDYNLPNEE